jgi:hypothetical protein
MASARTDKVKVQREQPGVPTVNSSVVLAIASKRPT